METRSNLRARLRSSRDWAAEIDDIEREIESLESHQDRSEKLYVLAALAEEVIPERDRALGMYQRAWKLYPQNIKALSRARQVYREIGRLEMVAKLGEIEVQSMVQAGLDGAQGAELAGLVGEALLDCGQGERARPLLERALSLDPGLTRVKDAIAALSYDPEDWFDDVERLSSEADKADSATAARMLLRAARIVRLETAGEEALGHYEMLLKRVLENDPQNESGNFLYESLLGSQKRWDELENHHAGRAHAAADKADQARLYRGFAFAWLQRFKDRERGAKFFSQAIKTALENGTSELRSVVPAFALLHDVYGGESNWEALLGLADATIRHVPEDDQLFLAVQAGLVAWKQLGDLARAGQYFEQVRAIAPETPDLLDFETETGSLAAPSTAALPDPAAVPAARSAARGPDDSHGEPQEAAPQAAAPQDVGEPVGPDIEPHVEEQGVQQDVEEEIGEELEAAMAQARAAEANAADKGVEGWRKLIAEHADKVAPRRELARVYRASSKWKPLVDTLKEAEQVSSSVSEKIEFLREIAEVYRGQLRNEQQAVAALNQIIAVAPGRMDTYDELVAYYESKKRWPDLVATLNKKAEALADPRAKVEVYLGIANLYIERFSNQAEAIKAFERVLAIEPHNDLAISHLIEVYEKRRDWEKLIRLHEVQIDRVEDPVERTHKTYEIAKLAATRVKKPEVCIVWWERVLTDDPAHEEAIAELYKLYERSKNWEKLAEICAKQANIAADSKTQVDALQKLGILYTDRMDNPSRAIDAWRQLLDIDSEHRRAQDALKKLYIAGKSWDELEQFYRGRSKLDEFVRVLERQIETGDDEDRLPLAVKVAITYRDELAKPDRAMRAFEKVLTIDEHNLEAAEALIPLYEQGRDPRKLVVALEIQLDRTDDPELRQDRIKRLAEYSEEKLRDKAAAFAWWLKAHGEDHGAEWIRAELERLASETGSWAELAAAYRASYNEFTDPMDALPLMLVVARVEEEELGEIDKALDTNRAILDIEEANEAAIAALERLYLGKERYEELLDIYQRKLELTMDGDLRTEIQFKIGHLYEDEVKDDDRAIEAYNAIVVANGEDPRALSALDRIYLRTERYSELADVLEREIGVVGPDDDRDRHLATKFRLGQVREQRLDDVLGAIECYRDILDIDPDQQPARDALEARLSDDEHKLAAAGILQPIYEQLEEWPRLVDVHEIQLSAETDPLHRVGLLMRIGEIQAKKLADAERAFDAFARCFREDPTMGGAKSQLEELCGLLDGGWGRLVQLFEEALGRADLDPVLAHELATKVAHAYQERLDDTDKAVEFYRRALRFEPDDADAIDALERIFTHGEKYPELLDVFRRKVDISADEDERLAILFRIASIHEEMLQNPEDAVSTYNEILSHDPDNLPALRALDRLYVQGEQWQDLGDTLTRQLTLCEDDIERVPLLVRLAELRETHLEELAAAIVNYRDVLELQPDNPEAIAALERLIGNEDHEIAIAQILEPIYRATANWARQISVYEIMAKHAYDPERKEELLHHIAELYEMGGDDGRHAFDTYARAFREEPASETTQAQLERLSRMLERWPDLVTLYDQVIDTIDDEDLQVQLLTRLAQIYELELTDDHSAVATYSRILDVSSGHIDAATAIQQIHERNSDYPALVEVLKRKSEIILDLPERKDLLYKAAHIEENVLEDRDAAIATYQAVLEMDDIDLPAMDALVRLYIELKRWEPLKDIYAKKAELAEDADEKKSMLYVLGQVYDRELGDVARAIETYQAVIDIDPDEKGAIQQLDRLFTAAERWYDLLQNLERQVELSDFPAEIVGLKYRIGKLWQERLQDLTRAIESYREALDVDPGHEETLSALDALMRSDDGEPMMAAQVLEPIYEMSAEFASLVSVLEVMVANSDDADQLVDLLHRIAELHETRLGQAHEAFDAYCRALTEDNGNDLTLAQLERLAESTGGWATLAELYGSEADKSLDVPRQVDLLSRLARIQEEELRQTSEAIDTYKRILEVEFDSRESVLALDRLYMASGQSDELAEVLRKEIQLAETDEEIIDLQFRLGQVLEQSLTDVSGAIEVYRDILSTDPNHTPTLSALELLFLDGQQQIEIAGILEPLYETSGEFEKLHRIYEVQLEKLTDPHERQSMFQRLAELAEGNLNDQRRAFHWWGEAACEDPRWDQAIEEAERLAGAVHGWDGMVGVYVRILEQNDESDVQRQSLLRLARVHEFEVADAAAAIRAHLRVLDIDPNDMDALAALDRLYEAAGMFDELVAILKRRIEITLDGDEIIELYFRRGRIYADALNDLDEALACYEAVLDQESRNRIALDACEVIFFRREDWQRLYDTYEKLIDVAEGDAELADVYARMARLSSDALDDEDAAIDYWTRVLDIRGEDPQALAALAELYGRRENWEELVEIVERQVEVSATPEEKVFFYKRLGRIWSDKLDRDGSALEAWLRADELAPHDLEILRTLSGLYQTNQAWEELSNTIRRIIGVGQASGGVSEDDMIELYAQLGQLEGDILGRVDDAVDAWRRVLALDPGDFRALGALETLFTREARWEECIEVLEKRSLVLDEPKDRLDTLLQAAAIWEEQVGDQDQAAALYERVRHSDASNSVASGRLDAIYRAQERWDQLNEVLLERVEQTDDRDERIELLGEVAKIYEEEMQDLERAFYVLQVAFRENYAHEPTADKLEQLATKTHKWEELLSEYTQMVSSLETEDRDSACDLWVKIGRWYGEHLSHIDYAIHSVDQALRLNGDHVGALAAKANFLRKQQDWQGLMETLGHHASVEPDSGEKVQLYLELANLFEDQMQLPMDAIKAYSSALAADATCMPALTSLERLYRHHEMWEDLIDVLGRIAEQRTDEEEVVAIKLEIGQLWDVRMLDSSRAISAYKEVLEIDSSNLDALPALEQLYEKTGQAENYLDILEIQIDVSPSDDDRIAVYERMASAWEERFGRLERAADCLEKIVAIDERNYNAYRELIRLYQQGEKWDSLVDTYRNYIMATSEVATRIDLYCAMGEVYERHLSDPDRAIEAYKDVLTFDPSEPRALDALGRLYENISEWDMAIDVMSQLVQLSEDPHRQVDLSHRIGRIQAQQTADPEQAEANFLRALAIDETHVPTMEDLVGLYSERGDWLKAAQMMGRAETFTENVLDKIRLLYGAARIYLDELGDRDQAKEFLAAVVALDPEHVEAAEPLSQLYFDDQQWYPLSPILDMLVRKAQQEGQDPGTLNQLYYRTARCADELDDHEKALQFYNAAYDIDAAYLPTLLGRADLLYKMQQWDEAGKIYQTILVQHRDSQGEADVVRIYYRLGMVRQQLDERKRALNMFEKALEIDPTHRETLQAVIELQVDGGDWEQVILAKRGVMASAEDSERVTLLDEIGDIYRDKLSNSQKAISAYLEALDIAPEDHQLLQKVLDLYSATQQWKKAVEIIERFIHLEEDPIRRGSYYQAAGTICRNELKAVDESIEYYDQALDNFFESQERLPENMWRRALKAFQDIDKILTSKRDWKTQEREYRKMIKRLAPGTPILVQLWHSLGEIYRSRLKHYQSAIEAFEIAQQIQSTTERGEILAELYLVAEGDYTDKAVAQHMSMLLENPFKYDSYKALRRIYMDTHQYDKTWCVCNTLAFLKKADPEEMQFYEQYKPRGFVKAKHPMNAETWRNIYHPDENRFISGIFGAIWQGAAGVHAHPHKAFGLRRKDRRDVANDQLLFSKIFYYVAQVLGVVPPPEVFLQDNKPGEIQLANTLEKTQLIPSFVVGQNLLQGRPEKEIAFICARKLGMVRAEHYLRMALPTNTELKVALLAAIVLVKPDFPVPPDLQKPVQQYWSKMQKSIAPRLYEQLGMLVNRFLQNAPEVDLARWGHSVDATSYRLGFVICGDLEVAARLVSAEPVVVGGPQIQDKIKQLILYSVSEEYFAVRKQLGLTIG
ncbi:MAG: tetratricopeptide repeat protein [Proteobacteria bacterium]|nr:tetratricopeptide repeat protein [Pseudomonadota bacterium]